MEFFNSLVQAIINTVVGAAVWLAITLGALGSPVVITNTEQPPVQKVASSSPSLSSSKITASTTVSTKVPATGTKKTSPPPLAQAALTTTPQNAVPAITNERIALVNTATRASLVNILCSVRLGKTYSFISGTGLIIDSRGVILTNAHIAQFLLLQNYSYTNNSSCAIRTGSPAATTYTAALLYLPPLWIEQNASQILSDHAVGTGERDYAFLYITGPSQFAAPLPSSFNALSLSLESPRQNDPVLLAGYPAGFLDANTIQKSLYASSAVSTIQKLYGFTTPTHIDLVSLGGTVISQSGSSGGAVINLATDKLIGLIATESEGATTASRDLRAITLLHIDKSLREDGKGGIFALLSDNLLKTSQDFNTTVAPALTNLLTTVIQSQP